jgi:tetratricopeptide (TPR) repeat protein
LRRNRQRLAIGAAAFAVTVVASGYVYRERQARGRAERQVTFMETTAEKEADEAMARMKPDVNAYAKLGHDHYRARRYATAARCFTRAIELDSKYAAAYLFRGKCNARLNRDAEALADYSACLTYEPENLYARLSRAACYATSRTHGNAGLALADLSQVPEVPKERQDLWYMDIGRIYSALSVRMTDKEESSRALQLAEENVTRALDLGLSVPYIIEASRNDEYRMLDAVLNQPRIRDRLSGSVAGQ